MHCEWIVEKCVYGFVFPHYMPHTIIVQYHRNVVTTHKVIEKHASCCIVEYIEQKIVILEGTLKRHTKQYINTFNYSHNVYIHTQIRSTHSKATQNGCRILLYKRTHSLIK